MTFERNIFQMAALYLYRDIIPILNKLEFTWWLSCGTLLGAVRDKDFIKHDSDIDIALKEDCDPDLLKKAMEKAGFHRIHRLGVKNDGLESSWSGHGVKVDFFWHYKREDKMYMSVWAGRPYGEIKQLYYVYDHDDFFPLQKVSFLGIESYIPKNAEKVLADQYGDWKTPVESWDWSSSPRNLKESL